MKQQKTFVCNRDVGRQGITVFSQPPPGHQWRAAVMFLTYVSHSKCVRGCWWGEVQQRRSEARQTHTAMPAVLEHFEWSLHSSGECWESFQWPLPHFASSSLARVRFQYFHSRKETFPLFNRRSVSLLLQRSAACLRCEAMRSPSQLWNQKSNSWAWNRGECWPAVDLCISSKLIQVSAWLQAGIWPKCANRGDQFLIREEEREENFAPDSNTNAWYSDLVFPWTWCLSNSWTTWIKSQWMWIILELWCHWTSKY